MSFCATADPSPPPPTLKSLSSPPPDHWRPPANQPGLFRLPRELRDLVYEYYVLSPDGYVYDFEANKIRNADGSRVDLSLGRTCRQVAAEMKGLALRVNTITFKTCRSDAARNNVIHFDTNLRDIYNQKASLLGLLAPWIKPDMIQEIAALNPRFAELIKYWTQEQVFEVALDKWGETSSVWRDFVDTTLEYLAVHDSRFESMASFSGGGAFHNPQLLVGTILVPWNIAQAADLETVRPPEYSDHCSGGTLSAASAAVRFFHSISTSTRADIRCIVLVEDRASIAIPSCHVRGLIPFCQENENLRIQRFANLWKAVFGIRKMPNFQDLIWPGNPAHGFGAPNATGPEYFPVEARDITKNVGHWISEASALESLGMPKGCFGLILDGNFDPEMSSKAFEVVERDVAWQVAMDICYARDLLPAQSWADRRLKKGYKYESLPGMLQHMREGDDLVQCNFDLTSRYDPVAIIQAHEGWSLEDWEANWDSHEPGTFQVG